MTVSEIDSNIAGPVRTHCPYCAFQCGVLATPSEDGTVTIAGDPDFPVNAGALCTKGFSAGETLAHPERLVAPLVRNAAGQLVPTDWDHAIERVSAAIRVVQRKYGRDAMGVFGGGSLTNEKVYLLGKFARVALRTSNIDYNGRFCMSSAAAAGLRAFGLDRGLPFPVSDIAQADAVLLVGANVAETMPPIMQYFEAQRMAGGQLIVVDPRRTATAEEATLHLRLMPGSDAILAHGLLHVLIHERLIDEIYIRDRTEGFEAVRAHAATFWPERVERLTGVPQRDIVAAARVARPRPECAGAHRARRRAAGAGRRQRAVVHQPRARDGPRRPALQRLRLSHRTGQRPGRPRARTEGRPAARLPADRRRRGTRFHRGALGHRVRGLAGPGTLGLRAARLARPRSRRARPLRDGLEPGGLRAARHAHRGAPRRARPACGLRLLPVRNGAAGRRRAALRPVGRRGRDDDEPRGPRDPPAARPGAA